MEYTEKQKHRKLLRKANKRLKRSLAIISNASHLKADTLFTDNDNLTTRIVSIEQNNFLSINTNDTLLHDSLSSNNLTNFDFAEKDECELITESSTFEKHTNINSQSCTKNISSCDHETIKEIFTSALAQWAISENITLTSTRKLLEVLYCLP